MGELDDLTDLIAEWIPPTDAANLARRILDAGYTRRMVVDDALVARYIAGEDAVLDDDANHDLPYPEVVRRALTAALGTDR